jgi:hypothetical protein
VWPAEWRVLRYGAGLPIEAMRRRWVGMLFALILLGIDSEKPGVVGEDCDTTTKNWSSLSGSGVEEGDLETAPSSESSVAFSRACRFALRLEKGGVESREVVDLLGGVEGAGGGEAERLVGFGDILIFGSWLGDSDKDAQICPDSLPAIVSSSIG